MCVCVREGRWWWWGWGGAQQERPEEETAPWNIPQRQRGTILGGDEEEKVMPNGGTRK